MAMTEDLSAFFSTADFAVTGIHAGTTSVTGILDEQYADVFQGEQVGVDSVRPVFLYDPADITSPAPGDTFVVGSDSYTVRAVQVDRGIGRLILEAA